jgi:putative ABC transport system ATP-binding protein
MAEDLIVLKEVTKDYETGKVSVRALENLSLSIRKGEFVAILGPSGSGKSTLMNIIGCIDIASSGQYLLDGKSIDARNEDELAEVRNRKIGFIFQSFNLLTKHSALYNVQLPLLLRGEGRAASSARAMQMLELVGLGDRWHHKPLELSGGQQQRVAIARALVGQPELLLADELTGALDSATGEEILGLITRLNEQGNTVVLITHDLNVAAKAKRVVRLKDGRIVEDYCQR